LFSSNTFYIASNVVLYFVSEERFASPSFYYPIIIVDTVVLTLSLIVNGNVEADFYFGLGLHIVKAFTEMLAGTVAVKSELDKGSTFTLTLPVEIGRAS
jgi:hypothetical protein